MVTDPRFAPLATVFRLNVVNSIVSQLDRSGILPHDLDRMGPEFQQAVYNTAFLVLLQLEEGRGFPLDGQRYHSHLVFTPRGETPAETTELISQSGRTIVHGSLTDAEVTEAIRDYLES